MKKISGTVSATIPQRQYENIRVDYHFEDEKSRDEAYKCVLDDCVKYHNYISRMAHKNMPNTTPKNQSGVINGIRWEQRDGIWCYFDEKLNKWFKSKKEVEV